MSSKTYALQSLTLWMALAVASHAQNLSLSNAYALALKHEPKLRSVALKTEATKEQIEQSKSRLYPNVQGSLSWGKYEYSSVIQDEVKENYSSYSLSATQPIFHPELLRGVDESKARAKGAEYAFQAEAQQLGLDVAKAYFELIRTYKNVDLTLSQKKYYETKYNQQQEMLKIGLTNRIDLLEAKIHYDKAYSESLTEEKRLSVAKLKLQRYIGEPVGALDVFDFNAIVLERFSMQRGVWEEKLPNNPSIKSSEFNREMARHQLAAREYEHYPKVDLTLARKETYTEDRVAHRYDNQAIIQMSIPLYQGGYTQSKIREGLKLLDAAGKENEYARQETTLQFEAFWAERSLMIEKIRVLRESEKSAELYLVSVEQGQAAGLKSLPDLLEARAKLHEVKRDFVDAGYELINNELSLLDLTGQLNYDSLQEFETLIAHHRE